MPGSAIGSKLQSERAANTVRRARDQNRFPFESRHVSTYTGDASRHDTPIAKQKTARMSSTGEILDIKLIQPGEPHPSNR